MNKLAIRDSNIPSNNRTSSIFVGPELIGMIQVKAIDATIDYSLSIHRYNDYV